MDILDTARGLIRTGAIAVLRRVGPPEDLDLDPLSAPRAALALVTIQRSTGDPMKMLDQAMPVIADLHPMEHGATMVSLAAMVSALADDDDIDGFRQALLAAELEVLG